MSNAAKENTPKEDTKRRVALTRSQDLKLGFWMEQNRERIKAENITRDKLAAEASQLLGVAVSENTVSSFAKEMDPPVEIPHKATATKGGGGGVIQTIFAKVYARLDALEAASGGGGVPADVSRKLEEIEYVIGHIFRQLDSLLKPPRGYTIRSAPPSPQAQAANHKG